MFFLGYNVPRRWCLFWDTKNFLGYENSLGDTKNSFGWIENVFLGCKNFVIDIFGGQKGLINCKIILDIVESEEGGFNGRR